MLPVRLIAPALGAALALAAGAASAVTVPFTESFPTDHAGWEDNVNDPAAWASSGSFDGGAHASATFNYLGFSSMFGGGPVVFRAPAAASGGAFVGDWLTDGVGGVSMYVRHDAGMDLEFFVRVAGPANFPGAVITAGQVVPSGVWTAISFPVDPGDPLCMGEGVSCAVALADVGNFQVGTDAPEALTMLDMDVTLDIDAVELTEVPEPAAAALLAVGGGVLLGAGARRRR